MHEVVLVFYNLENSDFEKHCFWISLHNPNLEYLLLKKDALFKLILSEKKQRKWFNCHLIGRCNLNQQR